MQLERLGVAADAGRGRPGRGRRRRERRRSTPILLDLRMPVLGGFEAARAIRERDPEIPILALTADTAAEDVERCRDAGMDGHLAKPVSLPALRDGARPPDRARARRRAARRAGRQPRRPRARRPDARSVYRDEPAGAARAPARRRRPRSAARGRARAALPERRLRRSRASPRACAWSRPPPARAGWPSSAPCSSPPRTPTARSQHA